MLKSKNIQRREKNTGLRLRMGLENKRDTQEGAVQHGGEVDYLRGMTEMFARENDQKVKHTSGFWDQELKQISKYLRKDGVAINLVEL